MKNFRTYIPLAGACAVLALGSSMFAAHAGDEHDHQHHHMADMSAQGGAGNDHQHHHMSEMSPGYSRQAANYQLPETTLVRSDGAKTAFPKAIDDGKPVVLNFIYTSCTAICPILSQSFSGFQDRLGADRDKVHLVSISIDPEEDTPKRLAAYAKRFEAGPEWAFYTGSVKASETMQKAFQAYFGDKMHHRPVTFMRAAPGQPWVRLDGFATPADLVAEYRQMVHR